MEDTLVQKQLFLVLRVLHVLALLLQQVALVLQRIDSSHELQNAPVAGLHNGLGRARHAELPFFAAHPRLIRTVIVLVDIALVEHLVILLPL